MFRDYVRRANFLLVLSDGQIAALRLLRDAESGARLDFNKTNGLVGRGLAIYVAPPADKPWGEDDQDTHQTLKLSNAGWLVCELLVEAGFFPPKGS